MEKTNNDLNKNVKKLKDENNTNKIEIARLKDELDESKKVCDGLEHSCSVDQSENERLSSRIEEKDKLYDKILIRKQDLEAQLEKCDQDLKKAKSWFG